MDTTAAHSAAPVRWGDQLTHEVVRGHEMLVYQQRCRSLVEVLESSARWGDREYLVDDVRRLTFTRFAGAVDRVADLLVRKGVRPGDRVMLLARNSIEWIVTFWASVRIGGVIVLGNAWWPEEQARLACESTSPRVVVADDRRAELIAGVPGVLHVEALAELVNGNIAGSPRPSVPVSEEDDLAVIVFTSGTTGPPKGAMLSHRSVIANQHNFLAATKRLPSDLPEDHPAVCSLLSTPLFHTGGIQALMTALLTGGRLVFLLGRFEPSRVLDLIERERVTVWSGVPTMLQRVLDDPGVKGRDLSSLRGIGVGGAPLRDGLLERVPSVFPEVRRGVSTNYGATEAGGIVASGSGQAILKRHGTVGRPLPAVEVVLDSPGSSQGEILVRSAAVFSGYWGLDEPPVDGHGWLHTGDVGRFDADGYLYVVDRLKDIVIRGGENIACPHVENALLSHPAVQGAAVFGLPHADLGEELAAVVVASDAELDQDELAAYARSHLAHFEVPSRWWFRHDSLPQTATGKVDKRALKAAWPADGEPTGVLQ